MRHAAEAIAALDDADVDDVMGDFWLRLVADDFRMLRAFNPRRGANLVSWLTFQVAHVAHAHLTSKGEEPEQVSLAAARHVRAQLNDRRPRLRSEETRAEAELALLSDLADFLVKLTLDGKLEGME